MAVDRQVNFISLTKACAESGCPICRIVADRTTRYLDNLLFEHVSDRGFRAKHRQAGGFCPTHSQGLVSFRDGLAVAILGRDLLEDHLQAFKKKKLLKPKERCPICVEQERMEKEFLTFLALVEDHDTSATAQELRSAFEASDGLCITHYSQLLAYCRRVPQWLKTFQEQYFAELLKRTSTFIELSAYGRQDEFAALPEKDKIVWKELTGALRGTRPLPL